MTSVLLGVLTANNFEPSADNASGRTWPLSNSMKDGAADAESENIAASNNAPPAINHRPQWATPPERLTMILSVARPILYVARGSGLPGRIGLYALLRRACAPLRRGAIGGQARTRSGSNPYAWRRAPLIPSDSMLKNRFWFQAHWLVGISVGVLLAMMGLTGATMSFKDPLLQAMNADVRTIPADGTRLPMPVLLERAAA